MPWKDAGNYTKAIQRGEGDEVKEGKNEIKEDYEENYRV